MPQYGFTNRFQRRCNEYRPATWVTQFNQCAWVWHHVTQYVLFIFHNSIPQYHCLLKISSTGNATGMVANTAGMSLGSGKFPQGWFHGRRNKPSSYFTPEVRLSCVGWLQRMPRYSRDCSRCGQFRERILSRSTLCWCEFLHRLLCPKDQHKRSDSTP